MATAKRDRADGAAAEMPERLFRAGEDWKHLEAARSERRRRIWAERRARWPLRRVVSTAAVWLGPWVLLGILFWASGAWGMPGNGGGGN